MIELVMLIIALAGIGDRAYRRGMPRVGTMLIAGIGWGLIFALSIIALEFAGPNMRVAGDRDQRERGSRPLDTDR